MSHKTPNYFESSYFIHQRYEDASLLIFQQQQRKKRDSTYNDRYRPLPDHPLPTPDKKVEVGRYGNSAAVASPGAVNMKVDTKPQQSTICSIV
ncbi:hypothetical protein FSP39_020848 [Pinctada imbricata]|uniref:Uncharacterized protein n=1 Tax=Pinctada imbricata TaxID=66713 RepID=A0AA88Y3D4_PINIB|nr:hypothetical protein FSP39_020848 [Pinctada imbricata]